MRFENLTHRLRRLNWIAVTVDFIIVVLGVFIGMQVSNANVQRAEQAQYEQALRRYQGEIVANLEILDTFDREIAIALERVTPALDALLACEETPEAHALVEAGVMGILGTYGLTLQTSALEELTASTAYAKFQTDAERRAFQTTRHRMAVFLREAIYVETFPLDERVQNNPLIRVGPLRERQVFYSGADYSRPTRLLSIDAPLDVACKDNMLVKSFYTWERWQTALPAIANVLRAELERDLEALSAMGIT